MKDIALRLPIRLSAFVKLCGAAENGGQAKELIRSGNVKVTGRTETHPSHLLLDGDAVTVAGLHGEDISLRAVSAQTEIPGADLTCP